MNKKMLVDTDLAIISLMQGIEDYKKEYNELPTILRCGKYSFIAAYRLKAEHFLPALAIIYGLADLADGLRIAYDSTFQDNTWSLENEPNSIYNEGA